MLLVGPTGVGKSALAMQAMILWGLGREAFGIKPAKPLKSPVLSRLRRLATTRNGLDASADEIFTNMVTLFRPSNGRMVSPGRAGVSQCLK